LRGLGGLVYPNLSFPIYTKGNHVKVHDQDEAQLRIATLRARLAKMDKVEVMLAKLKAGMASIAVSSTRGRQLGLITASVKYVDKIKEVGLQGLGPDLRIIANELQSLREGITTRAVAQEDLYLNSPAKALKQLATLKTATKDRISHLAIAAGETPEGEELSDEEKTLVRTTKMRETIPPFGDKEFLVARAPVSFTFVGKDAKHSSVGYVDSDRLGRAGFKVENLGGYTIIHNQLVIGIHSHAYTTAPKEAGQAREPQRVSERVVTYKAGKPTHVIKRRDKAPLDVAKEVMKLMSKKTGQEYSLVSEKSTSYNKGSWFWVMSARDVRQLAKVFPGGHLKVNNWGFAFRT